MKYIALALLIVLSMPAAPASTRPKPPPLRDTPQWIELSRRWRQISEHWSGRTVDRLRFEALNADLEVALSSLLALEAQGHFDQETRESLTDLFQRRYGFVRDRRYRLTAQLRLVDLDSHEFMARSRIEETLATLLWPPEIPGISPDKIKANARRELAVQVEFLRRVAELRGTIVYHRAQAEKRQAANQAVDWEQFRLTAMQRTRALIEDYAAGRIKPGKETAELTKYLLSLTEDPLPTVEERGG